MDTQELKDRIAVYLSLFDYYPPKVKLPSCLRGMQASTDSHRNYRALEILGGWIEELKQIVNKDDYCTEQAHLYEKYRSANGLWEILTDKGICR